MHKYNTIYKIIINDSQYYLHEFIFNKFDYFKPNLENQFLGEFKINFDFCDNTINEFIDFLYEHNSPTKIIDIISFVTMLEYLMCNDPEIYHRLYIDDTHELLKLLKLQNENIKKKFLDLLKYQYREKISLEFKYTWNPDPDIWQNKNKIKNFILEFVDNERVSVEYIKSEIDTINKKIYFSIEIKVPLDDIEFNYKIENLHDYMFIDDKDNEWHYFDNYDKKKQKDAEITNIIMDNVIVPYIKKYFFR